ncbi:hypothetical protein K457DRAFT_1389218 [Linnemannia elongata AG-77]|uniref:F-box domain-containing protein n=1 Tax=Linnemannia elongata AG-77 TaxID=1314771 RepID=A0A197JV75_9FUNG|nr:hypothetical protein K457DRAFT_1389218 [Linnemannia elongata AG-77]
MSYTPSCKTNMFQTHPLELHEIRSRIASSLGLNDIASCARVSQDWNDSFTPPLYSSVVLSKYDLSLESVERNKHHIKHLTIENPSYRKRWSSAEYKVISSIMANSTLTTFDLTENWIGDNGAMALSKALKTNSTLTTLNLTYNSIRINGAVALSEALKPTRP